MTITQHYKFFSRRKKLKNKKNEIRIKENKEKKLIKLQNKN